MDEEGSSSKPPTTGTTLHVPAEDSHFFEELPVDMQREEEDASQALQLLLHASEGQARVTNEASISRTLPEVPSMDIWSLPPLMVEGQQYLFLHDIETLFNLREDEALGVLCGFDVDTSMEEPKCWVIQSNPLRNTSLPHWQS